MNHLQNIRTFIEVVKLGSFASAAKKENIANSVVSKRVSQLEHKLGIALLSRTTRSVRLTELGAGYFEKCTEIVSQLDNTEKNIRSDAQDPHGRLKIYCGSSYASYGFAEDLAEFQEMYPHIILDVTQGLRPANPEHEEFDVCLQGMPITSKKVVQKRLFTIKSHLVASPRYIDKYGMPNCHEELPRHKCIFDSAFFDRNTWSLVKNNTVHKIQVEPTLTVNNVPLMVSALKVGMGIGIVPRLSVREDMANGCLVPLLPDYESKELEMVAYYTDTNYVARKISIFLDFMVGRYGEIENH